MAAELDDPLLTVAEVASILRLNQQTVRNWIDAGSLPALHIGRRVRIKRSDFDRLIAEGYGSGARASGANTDRIASRLRHPDSVKSGWRRGAKLNKDDPLWAGFGAAAAMLSVAIADDSSAEIADAFRPLADASQALGDAIASQQAD